MRLGMCQALLIRGQLDVVGPQTAGDFLAPLQRDGLAHGVTADQAAKRCHIHLCFLTAMQEFVVQQVAECRRRQFAHAVDNHIRTAVAQNRGPQAVLPIIKVRHATQRRLDAAQHYGHIGEKLLQDAGIDNGGVFGAQVVAAVGAVGILGTQTAIGRVLVDHRVHHAGRDAEEHPRTAQLLEVAVIAVPVRLRHDADAIPLGLDQPAYHRGAKRGMIHVGIGGKEDDVGPVPPAQFHFLARRGQEVAPQGRARFRKLCGFLLHRCLRIPNEDPAIPDKPASGCAVRTPSSCRDTPRRYTGPANPCCSP